MLQAAAANPNNGIGDIYEKIKKLPEAERKDITDAIDAVYKNQPDLAMVDSDVCSRMLTYAHVCSRMLTYADACSRMLTVVCDRWTRRRASRTCMYPLTSSLMPLCPTSSVTRSALDSERDSERERERERERARAR